MKKPKTTPHAFAIERIVGGKWKIVREMKGGGKRRKKSNKK